MTLTRSQKMYVAVLAVAAAAFVYDRATSAPTAAQGASGAKDAALAVTDFAPSPFPPLALSGTAEQGGLNIRLQDLARTRCLDASAPENAFSLPPTWPMPKVAEREQVAADMAQTEMNRKLIDAFRQHRLEAVVVGQKGYANVDGQGVFVGETVDRFTLLSVTKSSAVFGLDQLRVELELPNNSRLHGRGNLLEHPSPRHSAGSPQN